MKKNQFKQQQETKQKDNYFDDELDINVEEEQLTDNALRVESKPYEEYFEKFNVLYNQHIEKFQEFEQDYLIPQTNPDYELLIQCHFMVYEKNLGLLDFVKSDQKLFDKICVSFVYIDNQVRQIEEQFYKYLDKLAIYGELSDLHQSEGKILAEGEPEVMISRMLGMFKQIYDIIKKLINYITHLINQMNLLYNKKDPISKQIKIFNMYYPLDTIGRALSMIYLLDSVVEQNDYLQQHWNFYKRMIKIVRSDAQKYNTTPQNLKTLEKILIRLDKTVLSGSCLQGVLAQNWDQNIYEKTGKEKSDKIPAIKNNKDLFALINLYLKDRIDLFDKTIGTPKELFERELILPTLGVYSLLRRLYNEENRDLWKSLWSLQKKIPMVEGHSQVLCYVSKFLMEVTPLSKKSTTMDPKDPIANFKLYLQKLSQTFSAIINNLYLQFTAWLVRVDSFATSQASFHNIEKLSKDSARLEIEQRMDIRINLLMSGLQIANQVRNVLQSLLLGNYGLEEQNLDQALVKDVVLAVQILKAIEYYFELKYDIFQPALIQSQITKNGLKLITQSLDKIKANPKGFGTGVEMVLGALQVVTTIIKNTLTPMKLQTLYYCSDFLMVKDILKDQEKDDFRYIINRLDKVILLPNYVRKTTASTYFYWCRELLPQFFQIIYAQPKQAKRFQFLLNAVSDCSVQLKGCYHLEQPDELFESFRKFVVQEFYSQYLQPLARDIEDYLRIQVHTVLIEKITALNPFKQQVKDLKRLLDIDQVLIFDSVVNLRTEINQQLNETFYNMNVINMQDQETYEQMRSLANFKFGLHLINVYLPSQTIDQGSFDVLDILKNIPQFLTKYTYNLYQQQFVQITSESKQVYSISIQQISDSIRTHGPGILSTMVNTVYNYLKKKIQVFSKFLFDDYIQSPLIREEKYFRDQKDALDGVYPFERAEAFYKEVKKMGVFEDGSNYLDKFRVLITQIGNSLAFVRLLRSATLNFSSKSLEFVPDSFNYEQFQQLTKDAGFEVSSEESARELDNVFTQLKNSFSENTDYVGMLVKVFEAVKSPENKHLDVFYLTIPALTINYVEKMLIAKDQLGKRNSTECFISDDGFVIGVQYFLSLLDQKQKYDSLHWRKQIKQKFDKDKKSAQSLVQLGQGKQQSQRAVDEINLQKELSLRKLTQQYEEYQMFFYGFNSCKILYLDK